MTPRGGTSPLLIASSRAAAFGDIDNDGGVDIVVVNRDHAPFCCATSRRRAGTG